MFLRRPCLGIRNIFNQVGYHLVQDVPCLFEMFLRLPCLGIRNIFKQVGYRLVHERGSYDVGILNSPLALISTTADASTSINLKSTGMYTVILLRVRYTCNNTAVDLRGRGFVGV